MTKTNRSTRQTTIMDPAAQKASLLFKLVEDRKLSCGYERSFKIASKKLLANRFMLGVNKNDLPIDEWLTICRQMEMPASYQQPFAENFGAANLVFLGFEDNEPGCNYKIYLEFWDELQREIRNKNLHVPALLHLGFKWKAEDATQRTIARYLYHPGINEKAILKRVDQIFDNSKVLKSAQVAHRIIQFAAKRCSMDSVIYMEVEELDSPRRSFDINFYKAHFLLKDVWPWLLELQVCFGVSKDKFERLHKLTSDKIFGHLSGGIDRNGEHFITIFYEA